MVDEKIRIIFDILAQTITSDINRIMIILFNFTKILCGISMLCFEVKLENQ